MEKKKIKSIKTSLLLVLGCLIFLMGAVLTTFSAINMVNISEDAAFSEIELTAQNQSAVIQQKMDKAMDTARTLAKALEGIKADGTIITRRQVNAMLEQILAENSEFTGVYTAWEPNAFNDDDKSFVNSDGSDETGRFVPYWSQDTSGNVSMSPLTGYNTDDYYQVPKNTLKESIIEPYQYEINGKDVLMTSLVVPIIFEDEFVGIAGVDLSLDYLQTQVDKIDLYDGLEQIYVYSNEGMIAAAKGNSEIIGDALSSINADGEDMLAIVQDGQLNTDTNGKEIETLTPITVGNTVTPWAVHVVVPSSVVTKAAYVSMTMMILIAIILLIVTLGALLILINQITSALSVITASSIKLAKGDLSVNTEDTQKIEKLRKRKDELAEISHSFHDLREYMTSAAEDANKIANGDLTFEISSNSEKDLLGNALKKMIESLRSMVSQVMENAGNLGVSSEQLASAANQAGQATSQIAATIQQVAGGITLQSQSAASTANSVEQVTRAIDGVAQGAQEQASAVARASSITAQINESILQVTNNVESVSADSAEASNSAKEGARSVDETLAGMEVIKSKVGISAEKVQDMGARSEQIGVIVETIQDIASQTNMLALNAAIEAARAGENGKGFAVVADEVRKLAERSASATREIGDLVHGIQKTVAEAVNAMDESSREVQLGVQRANQSGVVLQNILKSVEIVHNQAEQAAKAAEKMDLAANELVSAMDSVSAVVEENTAATEEMAAGSSEVSKAVENIASVSEENSAAIEEVSASTEEMSAQVEEVTASAQSLADMAQVLKEIVSQFKL